MKFAYYMVAWTILSFALACGVFAQDDDSASEQAIYAEAEQLFQKGQYTEVLKQLHQLSEKRRRDLPVEVCYWFGISWYETGEWSFSEWYLLRTAAAHESSDARFESLTRLATIAQQLGKLERAAQLLTQALDDVPRERDFLQTALLIGEIQQRDGDYDAALHTYGELLKAYPDLAAAHTQRLWALHRAQRFEECLALATETIGKVPVQDRAEVSYLMAASHRLLGHFPKAIELYEQLLQTFPFRHLAEDARYELALCHYESGNFVKAVRQSETVLRGNPSRTDRLRFLWLMADAQAHQSQWQTAKDIYREIVEATTDRATASLALEQMIEMAKRQNRTAEVEELSRLLKEKYSEVKKP